MGAARILISGISGNRRNYELAIRRAGGKPISCYCPSTRIPAEGLLLAGGGDLDPLLLGEENRGTRDVDTARDLAEFALVRAFLAQGKPIFGICRGHQVLNVALGGKLCQDIGLELERFHAPGPHGRTEDVQHTVYTRKDSQLARLFGTLPLVNSWHHQAVAQVGEGFLATAFAESGLIEATEHETLPVWSVQFHPERLHKEQADGALLFAHFVSLCRGV